MYQVDTVADGCQMHERKDGSAHTREVDRGIHTRGCILREECTEFSTGGMHAGSQWQVSIPEYKSGGKDELA
jgi:hypothetical protein